MHVALLTQNCDLEIDLRPIAEGVALARSGHDVTLVGRTSAPEKVRAAADPVVDLSLFRSPPEAEGLIGQLLEVSAVFVASLMALARVARRRPIDVLHSSNPPDNAFLLATLLWAVQGYSPRFVFDQHDVAPEILEGKLNGGVLGRAAVGVARYLERASFRRADLAVFANRKYQSRAAEHGLLQGAGAVVPNGWRLPEAEPSERWRGGARHLVAYIGEIAGQDDVDHLVEAVAELDRREDVRVVIGGDGPARRDAVARAEELGIAGRFNWLGWMTDRNEIASLVRSADVCVAPETASAFNDISTFVKIIEYMSAGAPTAAHRLGATEELCGETIEYADDMTANGLARAIDRLLADPDRARRLGEAGRERFMATVDWEAAGVPRLRAAYESLATANGRGLR